MPSADEFESAGNGEKAPKNYSKKDVPMWTVEEDLLILQLVEQHGKRWSKIASHLPGRTDNGVRNRWNRMERAQVLRQKRGPAAGYRCRRCGEPKRGHICAARTMGEQPEGDELTMKAALLTELSANAMSTTLEQQQQQQQQQSAAASEAADAAVANRAPAMSAPPKPAALPMPSDMPKSKDYSSSTAAPQPAHKSTNGGSGAPLDVAPLAPRGRARRRGHPAGHAPSSLMRGSASGARSEPLARWAPRPSQASPLPSTASASAQRRRFPRRASVGAR